MQRASTLHQSEREQYMIQGELFCPPSAAERSVAEQTLFERDLAEN